MKQVIEDILNNTILPEYEDLICGFEIKEPHERFDTMGNTPFKFISVTVTFIAGPGTKYWPHTLAIRDKFDDIMNDIWDVIYNYTNIATDVYHKTVSKCEGKVEFMNEDYSPAGKKIIPNEIVVHKSNPIWRKNILETGLQVSVGECYKTYVGYGEKCIPAIFATNSTNKRAWFDSTYDDDIWFINTKMIPDVKWYKDKHFESTKKHIVTFENIPPEVLTLKYQGSGSDKFMNESENKKSNYVNVIKQLVEPFKNEDCVCDINVSYDEEDDMYSVYVVTSTEELREKFFYVDSIQQYILKLRVNINKTIVGYLPIENLYVGSYGKPNCEWNPTISEAHKVDKDKYVELYRDKDFILTIPLTHKASKKYGSDTKWCTTTKDCDKDFKKHTELGVLGYIVVRDKELKERLGSNAFAIYRLKGDDITRTITFDDQNNEYRNGESWLGNKFDRVDKLFQFYKMMNKYNDYFEKQDLEKTIEESKEISKKELSEDIKYNKVNAVLNRVMGSKYEWWKGIEINDIVLTKNFKIALIKAVLKVDEEWGEEQWGEYNMHMAFPGNDGWEDNETYELVTLGDIIGGDLADDLSEEILDVLTFTGVSDPKVSSPRMSFRSIMLKFV